MRRLLLAFALCSTLAMAADKPSTPPPSILGQMQPEIRLTDGTVFKKAKIIEYSLDKATATIAEPTRIRVVALDTLPAALRERILTEAGVPPTDPRRRPIRTTRTVPSQAGTLPTPVPETPVATTVTPPSHEQLLKQASTTAPTELKAYLIRKYGRVSSVSTRVVETTDVAGWPRIRVTGQISFMESAPGTRVSTPHQEKFEVEFAVTDTGTIQPDTVTFGGLSEAVPH